MPHLLSKSERQRRAGTGRCILILLFLTLAITGCDSDSDDDGRNSINGIWELISQEGDVAFLSVSANNLTIYDYRGDEYDNDGECYLTGSFEVTEVNGDVYTIVIETEDGPASVETRLAMSESRDRLTWTLGASDFRFTRSNQSVRDFRPNCDDDDDDDDDGGGGIFGLRGPDGGKFFENLR